MAKKKSRDKRSASRSPRGVAAFRVTTHVVVALLLCGAVAYGVRSGWHAITVRPEFRVEPAALRVSSFPAWVNGDAMTGELRRLLDRVPQGRSLFDPDIAHIVRDELASCPWLLEVTEVRRELPNSLRVKAVFRKPVAIVSYEKRTYMVDVEGHWLPERLFRTPDRRLPMIEDSLLREPPAVGRPWDGTRLAVGARLTQFLDRVGLLGRLAVSTIDVSGVGRAAIEPDITMTVPWVRNDGSPGQALVKWGRSSFYAGLPGLEDPILEIPDREKARRVLAKAAEYPGLRGIKHIDPRFHNQIVFAEAD